MEKRKTILIVDDEVFLFNVLRKRLESAGFLVIGATDGEEGLEQAFGVHPDLILLDVAMPKMDGMTMLKKLRQDEWGKGVMVIMLSNLNTDQFKEESLANGARDYLIKVNNTLEQLAQRIKKYLE